jgi:hypothetical protein
MNFPHMPMELIAEAAKLNHAINGQGPHSADETSTVPNFFHPPVYPIGAHSAWSRMDAGECPRHSSDAEHGVLSL